MAQNYNIAICIDTSKYPSRDGMTCEGKVLLQLWRLMSPPSFDNLLLLCTVCDKCAEHSQHSDLNSLWKIRRIWSIVYPDWLLLQLFIGCQCKTAGNIEQRDISSRSRHDRNKHQPMERVERQEKKASTLTSIA